MPPGKVILGAFTYRISTKATDWERYAPDDDPETHWGLTIHPAQIILLWPEMSEDLTRAILLHEIMHAAALCSRAHVVFGKRATEEQWVTLTAPVLLDALRRSPGMADYLFGRP